MLPEILSEIAFAVRRRREVLKITQEHLSELSGVALRTIRDVEQGTGNPSIATLVQLFEVVGLDIKIQVQDKGLPTPGL